MQIVKQRPTDRQQLLVEDDPAADAAAWAALDARQCSYEQRATASTLAGGQALERLLRLAESRDSGQILRVALFLGAVWNGARHFDLYDLRALDVEISDDMLAVLDALRWAKVSIDDLAPSAEARIEAVLKAWGLIGPGQTGQFICTRD